MKNLLWFILGGTGPKERIDDGCGCLFVILVICVVAVTAIAYYLAQ